jgi:catechol 2,3-dioxygenase-like lactoylglutathione lyase family enzyme
VAAVRIDHVNVVAPTGAIPEVEAFWCEVFGLRAIPRHGRSPRPGAWLDAGAFQIHLSERDGPIHPDQHVAIVVDDYDAVKAAATARGAGWEDAEPVVGSARGFVHDPAGNRIEVMAGA